MSSRETRFCLRKMLSGVNIRPPLCKLMCQDKQINVIIPLPLKERKLYVRFCDDARRQYITFKHTVVT